MSVRKKNEQHTFDVVIVGGGLSGLCAAMASSRGGARTALIHDRPVLGGNASSEIRMHICGASANGVKREAEETGIIHELILENKRCNDHFNYSIWDNVLLQKAKAEDRLTLFLNTSMNDVEIDGDRITRIHCYQMTTEKHLDFEADVFVDCTGNGTLAFFAGAEFRSGCEAKGEFNEPDAPDEANDHRMGNTLLFKAVDRGKPVTFDRHDWARHFTEEDLRFRRHGNSGPDASSAEETGVTAGKRQTESFSRYGLDYGYWWIELPGSGDDYVSEYEEIRDELVRCVYGVWDHLKNEGDHGAQNYDLEWVGMLPGVRESRRVVGRYLLTENDILSNRRFPDAVAYGGWPIDNHAPRGLDDTETEPSFVRHFDGLYTIPYRCYCNERFENLMQAGRILSATKLAMASSRVMGTCAVGGQAVGTAASMCIRKNCAPADLIAGIDELQQQLLKDDCYLPGIRNHDPADLARDARVSASSSLPGSEAEKVVNGVSRNEDGEINCWESDGIGKDGEYIELSWAKKTRVSELRLTFDSNLNRPKKITLSAKRMAEQQIGVPVELVKDYEVVLSDQGSPVGTRTVRGNYQRQNVLFFEDSPVCDRIRVRIDATNGYQNAKVFEIRVYDRVRQDRVPAAGRAADLRSRTIARDHENLRRETTP